MNKIKILYVHTALPIGGAEELRFILLQGLNKERFEPFVCCIKEKGLIGERIERLGIPVVELGFSGNFYDLRVFSALFNLIKEKGFQIVQSCMFIATIFSTFPARVLKVPVILSEEHCIEVWKRMHHKIIDKIVFSLLDKVIAVSEEVKNYMISNEEISPDKVFVLPNTADQKRFEDISLARDLRKELNISQNGPVIGIVGRLHTQKGHKYLFESLFEIKKVFSNVKVLVAGEGPLEQELKEYVHQMQLEENVIFLGRYEDILSVFNTIDVLVLPSLYEGQPVVILEAMMCEKPVVATSVGGIPELIENEKTGILVPPKNIEALSSSIIKILNEKEYAKYLAFNAKKRFLEYFTPERYVQRMECLYNKLLEEKNGKKI